jgi:aminopeptidase N
MTAHRSDPAAPGLPGASAPDEANAPDPYFPEHGDLRYRVLRYELELDYRPAGNRLSGAAHLVAVAAEDGGPLGEFALDFSTFRIQGVLVNGAPARYTHRAGKLRVRATVPPLPGFRFTVDVRYAGSPRPVGSKWGALGWEELTDGALVASQPIGAPSWYPCNDRPADKASYRIAVTSPSDYTVVANGALRARAVKASTTRWVYEQPAPTASYLVTVQIGRYTQVSLAHDPVPQSAAVPPRLRARFTADFARQPRMMSLFEELFGPYPFAEYTVVLANEALDVPVEAQGLSIFGANHIDGARGGERLVAHELAHQWFGNSLTVADWRHIWLNEGFAKYAEWLWSERNGDGAASAADLAAESHAHLSALPQTLSLADPGMRRMFDDRLYRRGGLVLHALRCALGDPAFFAMLRDWTTRHRHGVVTTRQFVEHASRHAARPLDALFEAWLYNTALPPLPPLPPHQP